MVASRGKITTQAKRDYDKIARTAVAGIAYDSFVDNFSSVDSKGLGDGICKVIVRINKQRPGIAGGVHVGKDEMAGDQGIMFGYASDETGNQRPPTHSMAMRLRITTFEMVSLHPEVSRLRGPFPLLRTWWLRGARSPHRQSLTTIRLFVLQWQ